MFAWFSIMSSLHIMWPGLYLIILPVDIVKPW